MTDTNRDTAIVQLVDLATADRISRRQLLRRATALSLSAPAIAALLVACGGDDEDEDVAPTATTAPSTGAGSSPTTAAAVTATAAGAASPSTASASPPAVARSGGTLTVAISADPLTLDPHLAQALQGRATARAIYDTLLRVDEQGKLIPGLAESWEQPDDRTYLLHLRQGVKFHDGTPFDAESVKFTLERILNPETKSLRAGEISLIDTVEAVDATTVRINLKQAFAPFLYPLADAAGMIISPTALERWGQDYGFHPVGAGPFRFVEYQKDSQTVMEKNPDYWDAGKPHLDRLILRPIPVDTTRETEVRSGGVQIAEALPLQDIQRLRGLSEIVVSEKVGFRFEFFGFNTRPEYPGNSQKFRQAFQWALDREALHQTVYFGTGSIGYDMILPGSPFFDPNYKPFSHDMERAKRLIDESGISVPLTIQTMIGPDPVKQRAAQIFQATAEQLGVEIEIQQVDTAVFNQNLQGGTLPLDLSDWWGYRADPDQYIYTIFHSQGTWAKHYAYNNPQMDQLIQAERSTQNQDERRRIFRQIAETANEDSVQICWHYGSDFKGLSPKVGGFVHYQDSVLRYHDLFLEP